MKIRYKWIQQYQSDFEHTFLRAGNLKSDEDELLKTLCRIKGLENEVDILKQAAVYFA